jgi:hypothetical protein
MTSLLDLTHDIIASLSTIEKNIFPYLENFEDTKEWSGVVNRRKKDNAMDKRNKTLIYKILHRKQKL